MRRKFFSILFALVLVLSFSPVVAAQAPAAFSVSNLSIQPAQVEPGGTVTITVLVANIGGESGSYTVVLKINRVKEAEETVTIAAGDSQEVSFSVVTEEREPTTHEEEFFTYTVLVDGVSGGFTIVVPPLPGINWPLVGGFIAAAVLIGLAIFFIRKLVRMVW